jgi:hypothetical protein
MNWSRLAELDEAHHGVVGLAAGHPRGLAVGLQYRVRQPIEALATGWLPRRSWRVISAAGAQLNRLARKSTVLSLYATGWPTTLHPKRRQRHQGRAAPSTGGGGTRGHAGVCAGASDVAAANAVPQKIETTPDAWQS